MEIYASSESHAIKDVVGDQQIRNSVFFTTTGSFPVRNIKQCAKFMAEQAEGKILLSSLTDSLRTYLTTIFLCSVDFISALFSTEIPITSIPDLPECISIFT